MEELAQKWVEKCRFAPPNKAKNPEYFMIGHNLGLYSGDQPRILQALKDWSSESVNYNIISNTCKSQKTCWPYTQVLVKYIFLFFNDYIQMIWADTYEVGCAIQRCDGINPEIKKPTYLVSCCYTPQ